MAEKKYNLIIIGAGPAGLSASIYASRYGVSHIIVGSVLGGQISETHLIDNYPGMEDMPGLEFSQKWEHHAKKYGVEILSKRVKSIRKNTVFELELESGEIIKARAVILATGVAKRQLNIPGEKKLAGHGISYCATCDGFFYRNKTVGVIGGSNSAVGAAAYLGNICKKVYIIYRKKELRAEPFWIGEIEKNPKIEIVFETNVMEAIGGNKLEKVKLDKKYKGVSELSLEGLFIEAGHNPSLKFADALNLEMDEQGYIKIQKDCATNVPGIFAAGDITNGSDGFRQVITAASEGAIAARAVFNWLKVNK